MNPLLPDDVLKRRSQLPLKPNAVTLEGRLVRLVPLDVARDTAALFALMDGTPITLGERHVEAYDADALIWRWLFAGPFDDQQAFAAYLQKLVDPPNSLAMVVYDRATGWQVGVACFMN